MTFDDILAQIIDLLKAQGRVSSGAIKRRYDLDDAYLEDLKDELIQAQRLATDEDGRILVWTGEVGEVAVSAPLSLQAEPQPPAQPEQPAQSAPLALPAPHTHEAERRQLTVMFCDVADATALSGQLEPEALRDVIQEYHRVCSEVINRFDGHVAQLPGDGLLIYFGYPQAHADDAQRAVRAGLGIFAALEDLKARLQAEKGITLAIRLGIHTGLAVVGAMDGEGHQEQLLPGETPHIAARMGTVRRRPISRDQ